MIDSEGLGRQSASSARALTHYKQETSSRGLDIRRNFTPLHESVARMIAERLQNLSLRIGIPRGRRSRQTARDISLARRLYNTFERDLELAEIQGIHFYVQNGIVTLYGTVRHELDRDLLMTLVREMQGVKGIVTHLQLVDSRFQDIGEVDSEQEPIVN